MQVANMRVEHIHTPGDQRNLPPRLNRGDSVTSDSSLALCPGCSGKNSRAVESPLWP